MDSGASNVTQGSQALYTPVTCCIRLLAFYSSCNSHRYAPLSWGFGIWADLHLDIQLKNLLLPTPMPKALSDFEEREVKAQSARKVLQGRTIYTSARFPPGDGLPLPSDFGEARFGDQPHSEDIMPNPYRAPEVILKSNWGYKVDIWNVAMVVSKLHLYNSHPDCDNALQRHGISLVPLLLLMERTQTAYLMIAAILQNWLLF